MVVVVVRVRVRVGVGVRVRVSHPGWPSHCWGESGVAVRVRVIGV
jgi:hypothetical protein